MTYFRRSIISILDEALKDELIEPVFIIRTKKNEIKEVKKLTPFLLGQASLIFYTEVP